MPSLFSIVFARDQHRCVYCGKWLLADFETFYTAQLDHLIPGGADKAENLVLCCFVCNSLRGDFVPDGVPLSSRVEYIHQIRAYVMTRRAERMRDFASWTHPTQDAPKL